MITPEDLNAMVREHWPDCRFTCETIADGSALAVSDVLPADLRPGGYVCGPTLFGAADCALWFLAATVRGHPEPMALTSDLSIRYLAPATGKRIYARAELNKASRRSMIGSVTVWMDDAKDEPCAIAQGAYILPA